VKKERAHQLVSVGAGFKESMDFADYQRYSAGSELSKPSKNYDRFSQNR
jgi:hypothetical protein